MNDDGHVTFVVRGEFAKSMDQRVLFEEPITIGIVHSHHELQIVDDDVLNVVNGDGVTHRLQRQSGEKNDRDGRKTYVDHFIDAFLSVESHEEHR